MHPFRILRFRLFHFINSRSILDTSVPPPVTYHPPQFPDTSATTGICFLFPQIKPVLSAPQINRYAAMYGISPCCLQIVPQTGNFPVSAYLTRITMKVSSQGGRNQGCPQETIFRMRHTVFISDEPKKTHTGFTGIILVNPDACCITYVTEMLCGHISYKFF